MNAVDRHGFEPIRFLMMRADGGGGVPRTVINLANALAEKHSVEILSLYRGRDAPLYPIAPGVEVTYLEDARPPEPPADPNIRRLHRARRNAAQDPARAALDAQPSRTYPTELDPTVSALTDQLLAEHLATLDAGVLVSTRPSLHAAIARLAPESVTTVASDHLNFESRMEEDRMAFLRDTDRYRLDCLVVLTEADARDYRALVGQGRGRPQVVAIPNALPWPVSETPSTLTEKVVVAGGRLAEQKAFDRLIAAYAPVARSHPDWRLRIFGRGKLQEDLERQVADLGLSEQVELPGYTDDFAGELRRSSIFALSSVYEGFPMVLIEAMSSGLPMVAYDCPRGPAELVRDGRNGRLIPDGDQAAFTAALLELIEDDDARRRMGAAAHAGARQYELSALVPRWQSLFRELAYGHLDRGGNGSADTPGVSEPKRSRHGDGGSPEARKDGHG